MITLSDDLTLLPASVYRSLGKVAESLGMTIGPDVPPYQRASMPARVLRPA